MAWVIERQGWRYTPRGWRPASSSEGLKYPTQGEAQEAIDEMMRNHLAALGGAIRATELP